MDDTFVLTKHAVLMEALNDCAGKMVEASGLQSLLSGCKLTLVQVKSLLSDVATLKLAANLYHCYICRILVTEQEFCQRNIRSVINNLSLVTIIIIG